MKISGAVFYGILVCLVAIGVRDMFFMYEGNKCSMTYMFEYPEYLKIKLPKKVAKHYPMYELYLYGEGTYAEENKNLILTGIPILFLPGNAGSYKQVRSLGSIALRKAENIALKYHFNFFSVNLNEELVAFYGGSLQRQTKFVHHCIKTILRLYKGRDFAPRSVVLVGHSMGGLVARALLTLKNFNPELITLIVTQATPHVAPVLPTDQYLIDFYDTVNNYWIMKAQDLRNITILSVAGGFRDFQVRSGLTFLPKLHHYNSALSVVSTSVPRVWASTDHLSIVWCKELILATIRAFFDLIDEDTRQITKDPERRMSVLSHHFVRHPAKYLDSSEETAIALSGSSMWIPVKASTWTYTVYKESNETFFTFPLANHRETDSHFHCQNNLLYTYSWIYGCTDGGFNCSEADDLSWETHLLPPIKTVTLKLQDYPSVSHFVLQVPTTNGSQFTTECEFFNEDSRSLQLPVTHVLSFGLTSNKITLESSGLFYIVQLQDFGEIYQAFNIYIERHCQFDKEEKADVYRIHVPWSNEDSVTLSSDEPLTTVPAKLHTAKPANYSGTVTLNLYSSQECQYEVTVTTSFTQVLGQIIRFHGSSLPVYILSSILLAYGGQFSSLASTGHCVQFESALSASAKPYKIEPIVNLCKFLMRYGWFKATWYSLPLWTLDTVIQSAQGVWFPLVSLILFFFGISVAYWCGILFNFSLRCLSYLWIALKRPTKLYEDNRMITPQRLGFSTFLAFISLTTCGAFALLIVSLQYMIKVIQLYSTVKKLTSDIKMVGNNNAESEATFNNSTKESHEKYDSCNSSAIDGDHLQCEPSSANPSVEAKPPLPSSPATEDAANSLQMHITIMNLLTWILLLCLPSLIFWLKNLRYNVHLDPDPFGALAIVLVFALEILMNSSVTSIKSRSRHNSGPWGLPFLPCTPASESKILTSLRKFFERCFALTLPLADPCPSLNVWIIGICKARLRKEETGKLLKMAARLPLPLTIMTVAFGPRHLYRVPYFVTVSMLFHVLCCFV
ncbi:GPI inositol-deacylase isoform X2 [Pleurodeles waltl]|uniref:GPI inositol-deacylase isoform X2 n=1 Tax=Pleurodeles waltl TaxID=8319 RepID=UPI0037093C34